MKTLGAALAALTLLGLPASTVNARQLEGLQETQIASEATGAAEQARPEEPSESVVPQDQPGMQGEVVPPSDEGAPVLVIPVNPSGEGGEEGAGETQLLIIPLEPDESETPQDEPQLPPEHPRENEQGPAPETEQIYVQ